MKKITTILIILVCLAHFGNSQCVVNTTATSGVTLVGPGMSGSGIAVAYNTAQNLYYSLAGGTSGYPIITYNNVGTQLNVGAVAGTIDFRGAWWNPTLNQLEVNGYSSNGIGYCPLNGSSYALGSTVSLFGANQPDAQSLGHLDYDANEIIYYNNGSIYRVNRATNATIGNYAITGLPVPIGNLDPYYVGYTGCLGKEIIVYDISLKAVYFINKSTGSYVATSQLPVSAPAVQWYEVGYANNQLFLLSGTNWIGYYIIQPCVPSTPPAINCIANISVNNDVGNCDAVVSYALPSVTSCDAFTLTQTTGLASGATFPVGITTNTFLVDNGFGTATCSFTVTVVDTEAPAISCPANIIVNNDGGMCSAVVNYTAPVGTDNCNSSTGSQTFNYTGSLQTWIVPAGVTSISVDVYGAAGGNSADGGIGANGGKVQADLTVTSGQLLNIYVGGVGSTCLICPIGGYNGGGGTNVYNLSQHAGTGGGASDIRIGGTNLTDRVVVAGGGGGGGYTGISANGGAGGGLVGADGSTWAGYPAGTGGTQLAGGNGGNGSPWGQPSASPGTLGNGGQGEGWSGGGGGGGGGYYGGGGAFISGGGGGSSYASGIATNIIHTQGVQSGNGVITISWIGFSTSTTLTSGLGTGANFPVGVTTETYEVTDTSGNATSCSFTVTVIDAEAPAITCLSNITVNNDAGMCDAVVAYTAPVGTDNCAAATTALFSGLGDGAAFPVGVTTETYEVTDVAGNATSCSFTVTVVDAEAPVITCLSDITVNNDAGMCDAVVAYTAPVGTDNCAGASTALLSGLGTGANFPVGVTTETYEVTDGVGNATSCSFTVTVVDAEAPAITCLSDITVNNDAGMCDAVVFYTAPVGTDNCAGATTAMTAGLGSGATFPVGVTTETYEVIDAVGNITSCSFTVTVVDAEAPVITCPSDISSCNQVVNYTVPVGTDNCAGATTGMTAGLGDGATFPVGTTTETYEVIDGVGNITSCSFTVTINPLPTVAIAAFSPDTICDTDPAVTLPVGTPALGTYSGNGVSGATFDPSMAGIGAHYVYYNYTDSNTCSSSDSTMIVVITCVGINENNSLTGISVFPNPANNVINISLGEVNVAFNFTLTSIDGKVVYQTNNITDKTTTIDISNYSKGVYFLRVGNENDYKVFKVIKQ